MAHLCSVQRGQLYEKRLKEFRERLQNKNPGSSENSTSLPGRYECHTHTHAPSDVSFYLLCCQSFQYSLHEKENFDICVTSFPTRVLLSGDSSQLVMGSTENDCLLYFCCWYCLVLGVLLWVLTKAGKFVIVHPSLLSFSFTIIKMRFNTWNFDKYPS